MEKRGLAHEQAYLAHMRAQGLRITGDEEGSTNEATLAAMRSVGDVIYQATLEHGVWSRRVDFLRKVDTPFDLMISQHGRGRSARDRPESVSNPSPWSGQTECRRLPKTRYPR